MADSNDHDHASEEDESSEHSSVREANPETHGTQPSLSRSPSASALKALAKPALIPRSLFLTSEQKGQTNQEWMQEQRKKLHLRLIDVRKSEESLTSETDVLRILSEEGLQRLQQYLKAFGKDGMPREVFFKRMTELVQFSVPRAINEKEWAHVDRLIQELFAVMDTVQDGSLNWWEFEWYLFHAYVPVEQMQSDIAPYKLRKTTVQGSKSVQVGSHIHYVEKADQYACVNVYGPNHSTITLTDPKDNKSLAPYAVAEHDYPFLSMSYIPSRKAVVASVQNSQMQLYRVNPAPTRGHSFETDLDLKRPRLQLIKKTYQNLPYISLLWDDEIDRMFGCNRNGEIHLFTIEDDDEEILQNPIAIIPAHDNVIMDMVCLPGLNPKRIVTCGMDGFVKVIDADRHKVMYEFGHHSDENASRGLYSMSYSPGYNLIVGVGWDRIPRIWMPAGKRGTSWIATLHDPFHPHTHHLLGVRCVPGTPEVITADVSGEFKVWDIRMTSVVQSFMLDRAHTDALAQSQAAQANLTENIFPPGLLKAVNFTIDTKRHSILTSFVRMDMNETKLAVLSQKLRVTANPRQGHDESVIIACYDHTVDLLLTCSSHDVRVWDTAKGTLVSEFKDLASTEITAMDIDVVGRKFILGTHGGEVNSYSFQTGAIIQRFWKHAGEVTFLTYDGPHKQIPSSSLDGTYFASYSEQATDFERPMITIRLGRPIVRAAYSGRAGLVLLADNAGCVFVYERTGCYLFRCVAGTPVTLSYRYPSGATPRPEDNPEFLPLTGPSGGTTSRRRSAFNRRVSSLRPPRSRSMAQPSPPGSPGGQLPASPSQTHLLPGSTGWRRASSIMSASRRRSSASNKFMDTVHEALARRKSSMFSSIGASALPVGGGGEEKSEPGGKSRKSVPRGLGLLSLGDNADDDDNRSQMSGEGDDQEEDEEEFGTEGTELDPRKRHRVRIPGVDPVAAKQDLTHLSPTETNFATEALMSHYLNAPQAEPSAICILHPFSCFVVADSDGVFTLWTMRPFRFVPVLRWRSFSPKSARFSNVVLELSWLHMTPRARGTSPEKSGESKTDATGEGEKYFLLYAADDQGFVSVWSLGSTLTKLFRDDGVKMPRLLFCWHAHLGSINTMRVVTQPKCIVTGASDGMVYVWSYAGHFLGSLEHGRTVDHKKQHKRYIFKPEASNQRVDSFGDEDTTLGTVRAALLSSRGPASPSAARSPSNRHPPTQTATPSKDTLPSALASRPSSTPKATTPTAKPRAAAVVVPPPAPVVAAPTVSIAPASPKAQGSESDMSRSFSRPKLTKSASSFAFGAVTVDPKSEHYGSLHSPMLPKPINLNLAVSPSRQALTILAGGTPGSPEAGPEKSSAGTTAAAAAPKPAKVASPPLSPQKKKIAGRVTVTLDDPRVLNASPDVAAAAVSALPILSAEAKKNYVISPRTLERLARRPDEWARSRSPTMKLFFETMDDEEAREKSAQPEFMRNLTEDYIAQQVAEREFAHPGEPPNSPTHFVIHIPTHLVRGADGLDGPRPSARPSVRKSDSRPTSAAATARRATSVVTPRTAAANAAGKEKSPDSDKGEDVRGSRPQSALGGRQTSMSMSLAIPSVGVSIMIEPESETQRSDDDEDDNEDDSSDKAAETLAAAAKAAAEARKASTMVFRLDGSDPEADAARAEERTLQLLRTAVKLIQTRFARKDDDVADFSKDSLSWARRTASPRNMPNVVFALSSDMSSDTAYADAMAKIDSLPQHAQTVISAFKRFTMTIPVVAADFNPNFSVQLEAFQTGGTNAMVAEGMGASGAFAPAGRQPFRPDSRDIPSSSQSQSSRPASADALARQGISAGSMGTDSESLTMIGSLGKSFPIIEASLEGLPPIGAVAAAEQPEFGSRFAFLAALCGKPTDESKGVAEGGESVTAAPPPAPQSPPQRARVDVLLAEHEEEAKEAVEAAVATNQLLPKLGEPRQADKPGDGVRPSSAAQGGARPLVSMDMRKYPVYQTKRKKQKAQARATTMDYGWSPPAPPASKPESLISISKLLKESPNWPLAPSPYLEVGVPPPLNVPVGSVPNTSAGKPPKPYIPRLDLTRVPGVRNSVAAGVGKSLAAFADDDDEESPHDTDSSSNFSDDELAKPTNIPTLSKENLDKLTAELADDRGWMCYRPALPVCSRAQTPASGQGRGPSAWYRSHPHHAIININNQNRPVGTPGSVSQASSSGGFGFPMGPAGFRGGVRASTPAESIRSLRTTTSITTSGMSAVRPRWQKPPRKSMVVVAEDNGRELAITKSFAPVPRVPPPAPIIVTNPDQSIASSSSPNASAKPSSTLTSVTPAGSSPSTTTFTSVAEVFQLRRRDSQKPPKGPNPGLILSPPPMSQDRTTRRRPLDGVLYSKPRQELGTFTAYMGTLLKGSVARARKYAIEQEMLNDPEREAIARKNEWKAQQAEGRLGEHGAELMDGAITHRSRISANETPQNGDETESTYGLGKEGSIGSVTSPGGGKRTKGRKAEGEKHKKIEDSAASRQKWRGGKPVVGCRFEPHFAKGSYIPPRPSSRQGHSDLESGKRKDFHASPPMSESETSSLNINLKASPSGSTSSRRRHRRGSRSPPKPSVGQRIHKYDGCLHKFSDDDRNVPPPKVVAKRAPPPSLLSSRREKTELVATSQ